jgi:hypothetical protein
MGIVSPRAAAWLAWSVCAVTLLLLAMSLLLIALGWSTPLPRSWSPRGDQVVFFAQQVGAPILGGLIASRRPENVYGWVWLGFGFGFALAFVAEPYAAYALVVEPGSLPIPRTAATVLGLGWVVSVVVLPFVFLLFPDGRLPSRRWRFVAWAVAGVGVLTLLLAPMRPEDAGSPFANPFGVGGPAGHAIVFITDAGVYVISAAIVLSALSLILRYRRAGVVQRRQIKWFALAAILFCVPIVLDSLRLDPLPDVWLLLDEVVPFALLYTAIAVAILRYRLLDIDLIINRALVYGPLTVLLAAVYAGGVVGLQYVFRALTGQESQLAVVASTLAIAALFVPLRRRVQALVDRRFYRRKYDARKTLDVYSTKLRDETDLDALNSELVGVVRETVQPAHASLWLRPDREAKDGKRGET